MYLKKRRNENMKVKKMLALTISTMMIIALGVTGCGKSGTSGNNDSNTEPKGDSDSVT